jgi:hypothetical protein
VTQLTHISNPNLNAKVSRRSRSSQTLARGALCECEMTSIYLSVKNLSVYHLRSASSLVRVSSLVAHSPNALSEANNKWHTSMQWKKAIIHVAAFRRNNEKHDNWYTLSFPFCLLFALVSRTRACRLARWGKRRRKSSYSRRKSHYGWAQDRQPHLFALQTIFSVSSSPIACLPTSSSPKWNLILSFVEINLLRRPFVKGKKDEKFFIKLPWNVLVGASSS